jgi:hypothetical protein
LRAVILFAIAFTNTLLRRLLPERTAPNLGISASLDGVFDGEVMGWAFEPDQPNKPLVVTIFVDYHPVAQAAAVHHRPDVAQQLGCSGRYGFHVDIRRYLNPGDRAVIDVRLENDWPLDGSPYLIKSAKFSPETDKPTVLFMHIPKTAGTAFREAIASNFRNSEIAYLYPGDPGMLVSDLRALPLDQRRGYRVVIGHYQFGMHWALPQKSEYITIVREPGARVFSQYRFLKQQNPDIVSLEELFVKALDEDFDNAMVRCFSGVDQRDFPPGRLTEQIYDRAVTNLHNSFRFVGHQEAAGEAYDWLRENYSWNATTQLPMVNRGLVEIDEPESQLEIVKHFNHWDFRLYEEIKRTFPLIARQPE